MQDSEEVFKDVTTAAANLRQEYKTVAAEVLVAFAPFLPRPAVFDSLLVQADAAPLMGILTALSVEARAAIRTAKKLWSEKQKRLSLAFLQKVCWSST